MEERKEEGGCSIACSVEDEREEGKKKKGISSVFSV